MQYRDIVPLGQNKSNFNYNLDEKRVLNFENIVNDSDNVKQDMSIDVYGRNQDEDEDSSATATDAKPTDAKPKDAKPAKVCKLELIVPLLVQIAELCGLETHRFSGDSAFKQAACRCYAPANCWLVLLAFFQR